MGTGDVTMKNIAAHALTGPRRCLVYHSVSRPIDNWRTTVNYSKLLYVVKPVNFTALALGKQTAAENLDICSSICSWADGTVISYGCIRYCNSDIEY